MIAGYAALTSSSSMYAMTPNHAVNRMRRFMASTWRPSSRRAGYLTR